MFSQIRSRLNLQFFESKFARKVAVLALSTAFIWGLSAAGSAVFAQGPTSGAFAGVVRDKTTGIPIPGAKVVLRNVDFDTEVTVITDSDGRFSKKSLNPGSYEITVSADRFVTLSRTQTLYATNEYTVLPDTDLEQVKAVVTPNPTVTPDAPITPIKTPTTTPTPPRDDGANAAGLSSRREGLFDKDAVTTLPVGGTTLTRTFDEFAFLVPGVNAPPQAIGNSVGPGVGGGVGTSGQFSVNGLRSRANNFTVDGSDNNDEDIGVRRQGFFSLVPQPIESIQEFSIITLLAPAEFGRNLGAQVNALSKSGGNDFHGSLFGFYNSERLNARNTFDTTSGNTTTDLRANGTTGSPVFVDGVQKRVTNFAGEKDKFQLLHGGFAVGGRLVRNKLFFFVSGEGQSLNGTQERNFAVPTVRERGLFNSGASGLQQCQGFFFAGACRDDKGSPINFARGFPTSIDGDAVFSLFPFANNPNGIYGANTYTQALSTDARGRILSGKVNYNFESFGQQQTFTARYNNTDDERDLTDVGGALFSAIRPVVRTDNFSSYLSGGITDNITNELRFSWGRTRLRFDELPDTTGFILPVTAGGSTGISNAADRRFMLNARNVVNLTLPVGCSPTGCFAPAQATYVTSGTTQNTSLGPIGQLNIAGFSPVGVDVFNFPQQRRNDTYQVADTVRWQIGSHSLAFGADIRRAYLVSDLPRNSRPLVTFSSGVRLFPGDNPFFSPTGATQLVSPLSMASTGAAAGFFQSIAAAGKDSKIDLRYNQYNFFFQDDWRVSRKASFNLGLRYEYNATPKEANNKIESTFNVQAGQFPDVGFADLFRGYSDFLAGRKKIFDADRNNFAPRLGFAYAATKNTVIRAGYGIYYDQVIGSVVSQSRNVYPTFTTINLGGGQLADNASQFTLFNPLNAVYDPVFQFTCNRTDPFPACDLSRSIPLLRPGSLNSFNPALTSMQLQDALIDLYFFFPIANGTSFGTTLPTRKLDMPFSHQTYFGIEHKLKILGRETVISGAYVMTVGRRLLRYSTPNLGSNEILGIFLEDGIFLNDSGIPVISGLSFDPFLNDTTNSPTFERPNRNIGPINQFETTGRSRYDALQVGIRGQLGSNLRYQANYTYGEAQDDASDVFDLAGSSALPQNSRTYQGEYAPANFDVRHRFTYNFVYGLPEFDDQSGAVRYLFGGWQVAGVGKISSGQPFTVNTTFDVNHDGNLTDRLNSTQFINVTGNHGQPISLTSSANLAQMLAIYGTDGLIQRNSFRANSIIDLDISVSKRFRITESQHLQFRADFFNFINRANFGVPVRFLEAPGFGRATDTVTPGRRIQFGLRYTF